MPVLIAAFALALLSQDKPPRQLVDLSLEELMHIKVDEVYTASRYVQKIAQAPAAVSVLTAEDLRGYGYRTLADALRSVRGFAITQDRNYSYAGLRGLAVPGQYNNRILFLVDGHRQNDPVFDGVLFGREFPLDVDLIDRIEVVRGPGSSIYGSSAFFGVVNVMTRRGRQWQGPEVSAAAGSFGAYEGRATFGHLVEEGPEILLSASGFQADGQTLFFPAFDDPTTNNGVSEDADGERGYSLFGQASWKGLTFQAAHVTREKRIPTGAYGTAFPSRHTATWDERAYLDLKAEHSFEGRLDVLARLYADAYWYRGNYEYLAPPLYRNKDDTTGYAWGAEIKLTRPFLDDRLKATVGAEFRDLVRQDQKNFDSVEPEVVYLDSKESSDVVAAFAQLDADVVDGLRVTAGLRLDHYDTFGGAVSPRGGLIWSPLDRTAIKLLYGRAFRAPSAYELFYTDGGATQKANPDLDEEFIDTYELVAEHALSDALQIVATAFHYRADDLITLQLDPNDGLLFFDNAELVRTSGVELELQAVVAGFRGRASWSYQQTKDDDGSWVPNSARNLGKINVSVPLVAERLFAGFELQYVGKRRTLAGDETDDYLLANLTLFAKEVAKGLELSASVYNLFDETFADPAGGEFLQDELEQDGLSFRIKATLKF